MTKENQGLRKEDKNIVSKVFDSLREIFMPIIPAITGGSMLQALIMLLLALGLIKEESSTYIILSTLAQSVFYFLPVLVAVSSARFFKVDQILAATIVLALVHPKIIELFNGNMGLNIFIFPVFKGTYTNSVFPAIFIVWSQKYIEKFVDKIIPDMLYTVLGNLLVLLLTGILAFIIIGPLGIVLGQVLSRIFTFVGSYVEWLVPMLLGGFGLLAVMTGAHYPLLPIVFDQLANRAMRTFLQLVCLLPI